MTEDVIVYNVTRHGHTASDQRGGRALGSARNRGSRLALIAKYQFDTASDALLLDER
jgi:hypothetical protein